MKKIFKLHTWLLVALLLPISFVACTDDSNVVDKLLETVPADTPSVYVINIDKTMKDAGLAKTDFVQFLATLAGIDKSNTEKLAGNEDCLNTEAAVIYTTNRGFVATMLLKNASKFKQCIEEAATANWQQQGDITYDPTLKLAFSDKQVWYFVGFMPTDINGITDINPKESFAAKVEGYDKMMNLDEDIIFLSNLSKPGGMNPLLIARPELSSYTSLLYGLIGEDIQYSAGNIKVSKEQIVIDEKFYNSKAEPANPALRLGKIDTDLMHQHLVNEPAIVALAMNPSILDKISSVAQSFGIKDLELSLIRNVAKNLDGTVAIALDYDNEQYSFVATAASEAAATDLYNQASLFVPSSGDSFIKTDGKYLFGYISDTAANDMLPADTANLFKDANIGAYYKINEMPAVDYAMMTIDTDNLTSKTVLKFAKGKTVSDLIK